RAFSSGTSPLPFTKGLDGGTKGVPRRRPLPNSRRSLTWALNAEQVTVAPQKTIAVLAGAGGPRKVRPSCPPSPHGQGVVRKFPPTRHLLGQGATPQIRQDLSPLSVADCHQRQSEAPESPDHWFQATGPALAWLGRGPLVVIPQEPGHLNPKTW